MILKPRNYKLFRTKNSIARIAKARADISMFVQAAIQMADVDLNVRMCP